MSKYNEYLTEIVYQIDDIIYEFYRSSNDLIATKRNTEDLLSFRDETISTVNNMNVRALEMIASFKKDSLVEERSEILLQRNKDILESASNVISNSPAKGELFNEVKDAAKDALKYTSDKVHEFQDSDTYANIKDYTEKGYVRLKDAIRRVSQDERVQAAKDKSKEAYHKGEEKLKDWWEETQSKAKDAKDEAKDVYEDVKDKAQDKYEHAKDETEDFVDDVKDKAEDVYEDVKEKAEDKYDDAKDLYEDVKDKAEDKYDDAKDEYEHLKDEAEDVYEDVKEESEKAYDEIKDDLKDQIESKREEFQELKDKIEDRVESEEDILEKEIEEIQEALKDLGLDDEGDSE